VQFCSLVCRIAAAAPGVWNFTQWSRAPLSQPDGAKRRAAQIPNLIKPSRRQHRLAVKPQPLPQELLHPQVNQLREL